jgi:hypothetical protein
MQGQPALGEGGVKPRWHKKIRRDPLPCDRKKSYSTYEDAVRVAILLLEGDKAEHLTAYRCPNPKCNRFHLSKEVNRSGRFPGFIATEPDETSSA